MVNMGIQKGREEKLRILKTEDENTAKCYGRQSAGETAQIAAGEYDCLF